MNATGDTPDRAAKRRVEDGLEALRVGLGPYVEKHMRAKRGQSWRHYASRAGGAGASGRELDAHALLKTVLDNWREVFGHEEKMRRARSFVSLAMDARNSAAHFAGRMDRREALRHLDAMREVLEAAGATRQVEILRRLYDDQAAAQGAAAAPAPEETPAAPALVPAPAEPPPPARLRPWREVCEPHPDVLAARFVDADFAANLALADRGEGEAHLADPADFFRATYATEGLRRVLVQAVRRLSGEGGEPVIGLQTNFGGGKTHTLLALHHLASVAGGEPGPQTLAGLGSIFAEAGVDTLLAVRRAVFVGTDKGPAEPMHASDGREVRTLWGYIAWRLGGWPAVDSIAASEEAGTNPGAEKLRPILAGAAPCLVLLDELVAFARQLRDVPYDAFHAFVQSLTEAAAAAPRAMVVGSLPESGVEAGDEQGRDALARLEKIFGRVQSAWTPASGVETYEIVRRRLFQPLDEDGEKVRDATVAAFRKLYRDNRADFPPETREAAYGEEMRRAYPLHPEVLRRFSGDWSALEKFQRTRGILKIMAHAVYALWREENAAPLILPSMLPFDEGRVRTALLEPLDPAYGAILDSEVDGGQALTARIEAQRPRFAKARAATLAARAVFFATAPHAGLARGAVGGPELRLACARPGDQIAVYGEALGALADEAGHLYREGDRHWFSPHPTLGRLARGRASEVSDEEVDRRIVELLREEARDRGRFHRVHAAPDDPFGIEDRRQAALAILPPSAPHGGGAGGDSAATGLARDMLERRGAGQRRYRNALVFVAADAALLVAARKNARLERGWNSVLRDADLRANLTPAQTADAESQSRRALEALRRSVRGAWVHLLCPAPPDKATPAAGGPPRIGFQAARIVNRGGAKSVALAAWDKAEGDGAVLSRLGPENLKEALEPIWPEGRAHIAVEELREWFASYLYLPRPRDEAVLDGAIGRSAEDLAHPYAWAEGFDEAAGAYRGVYAGRALPPGAAEGGLLVRREALPPPEPAPARPEGGARAGAAPAPSASGTADGAAPGSGAAPESAAPPPGPARFFATVPLDPDRAAHEVARIMDGLLAELTRGPGSTLKATLDLAGEAGDGGYAHDVVETAEANARDLGLPEGGYGFERDG